MNTSFSLHGANRFLERDIPLEALLVVKTALPMLNEKPLRFRTKEVTVVARMKDGTPKIITAWKNRPRKD